MVGYGGKDLQKRKVLSLECKSKGVMDDESGESMELMEEMPLDVPVNGHFYMNLDQLAQPFLFPVAVPKQNLLGIHNVGFHRLGALSKGHLTTLAKSL